MLQPFLSACIEVREIDAWSPGVVASAGARVLNVIVIAAMPTSPTSFFTVTPSAGPCAGSRLPVRFVPAGHPRQPTGSETRDINPLPARVAGHPPSPYA